MLHRFITASREVTHLVATLAADDLRGATPREFSRRLVRIGLMLAVGASAAVALSASAAEPARPSEPMYNVELVILRPVTPIGVPEDWSMEANGSHAAAPASGDPEEDTGEGVVAPGDAKMAVRSLSSAQYRLAGVDAAVARSRGYELIRHVGWTQSATPRGAGLAVDIADISTDGEPLRGTVSLERGRYLHLKLDLAYAPTSPPNSLLGATESARPVTFTLRQSRRVKSFERHYFDHPAFGVIAMVSPVGSPLAQKKPTR